MEEAESGGTKMREKDRREGKEEQRRGKEHKIREKEGGKKG